MNDAAKKLVLRAARAEVAGQLDRLQRGASRDEICATAWQYATAANPELKRWSGAEDYFETVFLNEIEQRDAR